MTVYRKRAPKTPKKLPTRKRIRTAGKKVDSTLTDKYEGTIESIIADRTAMDTVEGRIKKPVIKKR